MREHANRPAPPLLDATLARGWLATAPTSTAAAAFCPVTRRAALRNATGLLARVLSPSFFSRHVRHLRLEKKPEKVVQ